MPRTAELDVGHHRPESTQPREVCGLPLKELPKAANIAIDPALLDRAVQVSGERTKKVTVTKALQVFIARREQQRVANLLGKLEWDQTFDYKAERSRHK